MAKVLRWFCIAILAVTLSATTTVALVAAQEQTDNQTENTPGGGESIPAASAENEQGAAEQEQSDAVESEAPSITASQDTFVPSEEISEDLSVSFPVDI